MIEFLIGFLCFLCAGMGLGGGALLIPLLVNFFDFPQGSAQYVGLIAYIPASICAVIYGLKNKDLQYAKILPLIPLGLLGAFLGAFFAMKIQGEQLRKLYGIFMIFFGAYMLFSAAIGKKGKQK